MKNFTPFGRLLLLAVFLLSAIGLSAQQSCNLDPSLIEITVKNTCTDGGTIEQPYVTIDFGSTVVDGMTEITIESFFLGTLNLGTHTFTVPVVSGFATFELPGFAIGTPNNFVRLNEIEDLETGCVQTFSAGEVESDFYSLTTTAAITITKSNNRSIDPPCGDIPTGKLSIRVSPNDGIFLNNRFSVSPQDVRLVPSTFATFISIIPPGTSPNPTQAGAANAYYIIETNQSLVSGDYTFLVFDNIRGCEVAFESVVGNPANDFNVEGLPTPVTCFGGFDGSIQILPQNANPAINGFLNYTLTGPNGLQRTGTIAASNGVYNMPTEAGLEAGDYDLALFASNGGCTGSDEITIVAPNEIVANELKVVPVCANESSFVITASSITGIDANATYRLIDGSQFDPAIQDNSCWDRAASLLSSGLQVDDSYEFSIFLPGIGFCRDIDRDTVVTVYMEIENQSSTQPSSNCVEIFQFDVQIDAQPATPIVTLSATNLIGDPAGAPFCSNQDVAIDIDNYVSPAGFTYDISYTPVMGVIGADGFANDAFVYTGPGSVVGSFNNTTNNFETMNFVVTATNDATGCVSEIETFNITLRPLPVVDVITPNTAIVCSRETYTSPAITLNGNGGNSNVRFRYEWTLTNPSDDFAFLASQNNGISISDSGLSSGSTVDGRFRNITGVDQTATLTITPVFPQTGNDCEGASSQITVTVSSRPSLSYDLTIGDSDTMLTSPDIASFEICNGQDFTLDNLAIAEDHAGGKLKYVRYRVRGDARFLQINTGGSNFGPTDVQTTQYLAIDNFAIGQPNIQNNHPNDNAQVAEIILTPYYQTSGAPANAAASQMCAGQAIRLFLTVNPTPPVLPSPQEETVCSDERIEYTILGASGNGSTLETRITETNVFPGQTVGSFTVPEGANRIDNFRFTLTGGNGGSVTTTGGVGGFGASVTGTLDATELLPGDVVDVRKGLAGGANNSNGDGGDATILTVTRGGSLVYTFIAAGGGGAGSAEDGEDGLTFAGGSAADGAQGQGPGGFGGTGSPTSLGGDGNVNGGGGGGGWIGGDGGNSQAGESGDGGESFSSTTLAPASFAPKTSAELADGQAEIFYTVVYDDILFNDVIVDFDADSLTDVGEAIVNGEVDTILFGQQFINNTNNPQDVTYTLTPVTQANCGDMSTIEVVVTIEPQPMATIASGSTTTVTGNATDGYEAIVCSGDPINAILNSLTTASDGPNRLYFEVSTTTSTGTGTFGSNPQAASNSTDFGGDNTGSDLPIDFFETGVSNNTGVDGTITYTITPYIRNSGPNCAGTPITLTVTVQPGFSVNMGQPQVNVCSREALNTVFDLDASQTGFINIIFNDIRVVDFRVNNPSADFTFTGLDTTGLAAGGFMLDRTGNFFNDAVFINRTGGGVGVEFDVVFISENGCESQVVTYDFNSRAEPIIDESVTAVTVCEGEVTGLSVSPAANSAFDNSFAPTDVTFSYTLDEGAMTHTGNVYPVSGVGAFRMQNDAFSNPTSMPQTATYTVVATSRFGCASQPVTYTVTVLPSPELTVTANQGDSTITGEALLVDVDTITICSGSTVDFALSQDVTGTDVSYRIQRIVTGMVTNGDGSAIDNFEGGLAIAGFQETLMNTGTGSAAVLYNLAAYTYGGNGMDDDGLSASDDCQGITKRVVISVLPATTDESSLDNNITINNPNVGSTFPGNGAQICDNSEVIIRPTTTIDPTTGTGFIWERENDGTTLGGITSGKGGFQTTVNNGEYLALFADRIQQVLTAEDDQTTEVRYIVTLYSFGTDGVNDLLAPGSDDCLGDIDTITLQLDPTPELSYDLEIGTAAVQRLDVSGSPYLFEICSGEDFLISNLDIPELADNNLNYVQLRAAGDVDFLGLPTGGTFIQVAPANNFSLGAQNVQTTSPTNSAQTARIRLIPYFEDGNDTNSRSADECAGEPIILIVTLNPTPDPIAPASATFCSDELTEFTIPTSGNNFRSRVAQTEDFSASNDYVVPPGVFAIRDINVIMTGGNGGSSNGSLRGGLGGKLEFELNDNNGPGLIVLPGDTIRIRKGNAGAGDVTFGNGGDATLLCVIAGSDRGPVSQGDLVETFVAAGGGGAGQAFAGEDANVFSTDPNSPAAADGSQGLGLGGFGGTGWDMSDPASGSLGNNGLGNGGGGGGGWAGGDGGANTSGMEGEAGTSYAGIPGGIGSASFSTKDFSDADAGEVSMDFLLVYDDVLFTLVDRTIGTGLIDLSADPLTVGASATDTILFGERFENPTDASVDVVYTFSTSSEASCPGSEVEVTLTIEPNPTLDLASNGTTVSDDGDGNYSAAICSGDGISAIVSSDVIPSTGASMLRARVLTTTTGNGTVTFGNNANAASQTTFFNGNNQPSVADVDFFEDAVSYDGADTATVTYRIIPVIVNSSFSGAECFGDTITFTVSVYPEFLNEETAPTQVSLCSNVSLEDAGFDIATEQAAVLVAYDSIIIDTVITVLGNGNSMGFDTVSSVYNGAPVTVRRSEGFFNGDTYRNRTGAPVIVTYEVRLVSGPDCTSDPILYAFRYTAEPVIDIVESATNQIDTTICNTAATGIVVTPASNSAFSNPADFSNNITLNFEAVVPQGVVLTNGTYPATGGPLLAADDELENTTASPLDVVYTVTPLNGSCEGDAVTYTVTVNPNPDATVMLTSLDSTASFSLENSRVFLPNPEFGVCSGQALTTTIPAAATVDNGTLMAVFSITADASGISGYTPGMTFVFLASELGDSLSYAMGELINTTASPQSFTVQYSTYFEGNGTPGNQNDGVDCGSNGAVEFDIVLNPANGAIARTELDGTPGVIPAGMDTLCSGEVFDFFVRNSDIAGIPVDSFLVEVTDAGLDAVTGTPTGSFIIQAPATPANGVRMQDFSYTNTTPGIKTATYIVTPFSGACEGTPDTTTISYRAEFDLEANETVLCADPGVSTSVFAIDANGGTLSSDRQEYRYAYIGGTASGYTLQGGTGAGNPVFVFDPSTQANTSNLVFNNQSSVTVTPSPNSANFTPGTVDFQVIYDDSDTGCQSPVTDTITLNFQTTAEPGMANQALAILCDEVNFLLSDALIGEDEGGVFTFTNGDPGQGVLNGANFTPMVGGSDPTPVAIDFTYTVGGGNSGCATASIDFSIMVEPAPNAGTYDGTVGEACESAPAYNLFDLLDGEMQNGMFTQTAGVDFVTANPDGTIDQDNITPGTYTFTYEVMSANACGSDMVTGIMVQVNDQMSCSTSVPCDTIDMNPGFNVISFDVLPNDRSVESVFADEIANNTLLTVIAIHPDEQASAQLYSFNPTFGTVSSGIAALRPGYGYVVEMASAAQVIACGTAVDTSIRVELQSGLNIVGYTKPGIEFIFDYFSTLIGANDVNLIRTIESGILRQLRFNPNPSGNLFQVRNSNGYLLDVNAAYADGTWRDGEVMPTSNFDRLFGYTNLPAEMAGQTIRFTDAEGNLYGRAELRADGTYDDVMLYGDLTETVRQREGLEQGEEIFAEFQGERIATGETFSGNWNLRQMDLNFNTEVETPETVSDFAMSVFPNPTSGDVQVKLDLDQDYDFVRVEVYSLLGQLVIERNLAAVQAGRNQVELDFTDLAAGTYQLRITTKDGVKGHAQIIRQ